MDEGAPLPPVFEALRGGVATAEDVATFEAVEAALLETLSAPDPSAMGVPAWDRAFDHAALVDPERRARRMLGKRKRPADDDEETPPPADEVDGLAMSHAAAVLSALEQIDARRALVGQGDAASQPRWAAARAELERRLSRACAHAPALKRAVVQARADGLSGASARLRAAAPDAGSQGRVVPVVVSLPPTSGDGPYAASPDAPLAAEPAAPPPPLSLRGPSRPLPEVPATPAARPARPARPASSTALSSGRALELGGLAVGALDVQLPPEAERTVALAMERAVSALPDVLRSRGQSTAPAAGDSLPRLDVVVDLPSGVRDASTRGRLIADQIADALLAAGHRNVERLQVDVRVRGGGAAEAAPSVDDVLARLGAGDDEGVARLLAEERRPLDATQRARLADFFGEDFADVSVFAGAMSGALARGLSAEAFTHGRMVFFDPKHFRPDTAQGEALLAHELAHTRQAEGDTRTGRAKEAEALATEASYLSWISPAGAPLAMDTDPLAPSKPSAAAADDPAAASRGVARAATGRAVEQAEGPREDTAKFEKRVEQVLERVRALVAERGDFESDRVGRLVRSGIRRL